MIQLKIDVVYELRTLLPSYYQLTVPSIVLDELNNLRKNAKGKNKLAASIAYKIAGNEPFVNVSLEKTEYVDNILLDYCTTDDVLCTNDKNLRKRARNKGITVIYLRQHKYLEVDGYIKHN